MNETIATQELREIQQLNDYLNELIKRNNIEGIDDFYLEMRLNSEIFTDEKIKSIRDLIISEKAHLKTLDEGLLERSALQSEI